MGIVERREREKEQRRNDIIDAAERIFFSKGRVLATMDDVAEEAELSKGTLYLYFKNKEELYLAINLRGLKILTNLFEEALTRHKTGIEKIEAIGQAYLQFYREYPDYFNALLYFESQEMAPEAQQSTACECHDYGEMALGLVAKALQSGIDDGTIRPDIDPIKTATVLWGQTSGLIQLIALKGDHLQRHHGINIDEIIMSAFELIRYALKK